MSKYAYTIVQPLPMDDSHKKSALEEEFMDAYDEYADAIFRHCYYRVFDREHGKDLMQETFIRAWQYLAKGGEVDNMKAFLYKVANNLVIDASRKKREMSLDHLQEGGFEPSFDDTDHWKNKLEHDRLVEALELLDDDHRQAVTMRYIQELSPVEIAEKLGLNPNVVSVRIYRGLKQLRAIVPE